MRKIYILSFLAGAAALVVMGATIQPGGTGGSLTLTPNFSSVYINVANTNRYPLRINDSYGSNLLSLIPNLGAGSNYWGLHIGTYTPGKEVQNNIADFTLRMSANSIFAIAFGSDTNTFGCDTGSSIMAWGDVNNSAGGVINNLFSRQAIFYPQHLEPSPINNNVGPTLNATTNAGTGTAIATTSGIGGTDVANTIQLTTGTANSSGVQFTNKFVLNYSFVPTVVFSPANTNAAAAMGTVYISSRTTSNFVVSATAALVASKVYIWDFIVIQ